MSLRKKYIDIMDTLEEIIVMLNKLAETECVAKHDVYRDLLELRSQIEKVYATFIATRPHEGMKRVRALLSRLQQEFYDIPAK